MHNSPFSALLGVQDILIDAVDRLQDLALGRHKLAHLLRDLLAVRLDQV